MFLGSALLEWFGPIAVLVLAVLLLCIAGFNDQRKKK